MIANDPVRFDAEIGGFGPDPVRIPAPVRAMRLPGLIAGTTGSGFSAEHCGIIPRQAPENAGQRRRNRQTLHRVRSSQGEEGKNGRTVRRINLLRPRILA